ncbi:MAG: DUF1289 domain-containing protein [Pseudomonadota bacterium]
MTASPAPTPATPCIGICSTGIGDSVCRGCMRFAHEVSGWNGFDATQRRLILARGDDFLARVLANRVDLFDTGLLRAELARRRVPWDPARDPHRWLYDLLRQCGSRIGAPEACGFRLRAGIAPDLVHLCRSVERDWHRLATAHYERYVEPGLRRRCS